MISRRIFVRTGFDFAQGTAQSLVRSTFHKRWADANASWARMVDPSSMPQRCFA